MRLISKFKKGSRFLLCVIDKKKKNPLVIPLKYKKGVTITMFFKKIFDESNHKLNKTWVNKGNEF